MNPIMSGHLAWQDDRLLVEFLADQLLRGRLLLCLGAGVSRFYGLPSWEILLQRISKSPPTSPDLALQAELVLDGEFGGDQERFHRAVHGALYASKGGAEDLLANKAIRAIGALVSQSLRGKVASILTFNYDDLVEQYTSFHGYVVQSVVSERYLASVADVIVYHPHGFLPEKAKLEDFKSNIVLTRRDYERAMDELWQETILKLFSTHLVLFIGQSGADARISAILANAKGKNPYITRFGLPYYGLRLCSEGDTLKTTWESRGIFCKTLGDLEQEIPQFLFDLCQFAARSLGDPNE